QRNRCAAAHVGVEVAELRVDEVRVGDCRARRAPVDPADRGVSEGRRRDELQRGELSAAQVGVVEVGATDLDAAFGGAHGRVCQVGAAEVPAVKVAGEGETGEVGAADVSLVGDV